MKRLSFYELTALQTAENIAGRALGTIRCCNKLMRQTYICSNMPEGEKPSYSFIILQCSDCERKIELKTIYSLKGNGGREKLKTLVRERKL